MIASQSKGTRVTLPPTDDRTRSSDRKATTGTDCRIHCAAEFNWPAPESSPGSELVCGSIWTSMGGQDETQAVQC